MNKLHLLLIYTFATYTIAVGQMYEFTSTEGHRLVAEIISIDGSSIKVRRQDNEIFEIDKNRFSQADIQYIKNWEQKTYHPKLTSKSALSITVNAVKNEKRDFSDHDNETVEIYPTVKIVNQELYANFDKIHATVILLGKHAKRKTRKLKVLSKESFTFSIDSGEHFQWKGEMIESRFDDKQKGRFGYEYYGYVFILKNKDGDAVYTKAPAQWLVQDLYKLESLKVEQKFNPNFK